MKINSPLDESISEVKNKIAALKNEEKLARKPRVKLDDAAKAKIIEQLKAKIKPLKIAGDFNVSVGTVNIIKKEAGLVKPHATKS